MPPHSLPAHSHPLPPPHLPSPLPLLPNSLRGVGLLPPQSSILASGTPSLATATPCQLHPLSPPPPLLQNSLKWVGWLPLHSFSILFLAMPTFCHSHYLPPPHPLPPSPTATPIPFIAKKFKRGRVVAPHSSILPSAIPPSATPILCHPHHLPSPPPTIPTQRVGLRRSERATTPLLLNSLAIKGMGWQWIGVAGSGGGGDRG